MMVYHGKEKVVMMEKEMAGRYCHCVVIVLFSSEGQGSFSKGCLSRNVGRLEKKILHTSGPGGFPGSEQGERL